MVGHWWPNHGGINMVIAEEGGGLNCKVLSRGQLPNVIATFLLLFFK